MAALAVNVSVTVTVNVADRRRGVPFPGFLQEGRGVKSEEKPL